MKRVRTPSPLAFAQQEETLSKSADKIPSPNNPYGFGSRNTQPPSDLYSHFAHFYGQGHMAGSGLHVTPTSSATEYGIGMIGHQPRAAVKAETQVDFPDLDNSWNGCDRSVASADEDDDIRSSKRRKVIAGESASPVTSNEHSPEQTVPHGLNAANASISFYGAPPYPGSETTTYGYYGNHGYYAQQAEPIHTGSGY